MDSTNKQPDFVLLAKCSQEFAAEFQRLANFFTASDERLITQMTDLTNQVSALSEAMNNKLASVQTEMANQRLAIQVMDKNLSSRLKNSMVLMSKMTLSPMYNITTGEIVDNCPRTLGDLERSSASVMGEILRELGKDVPCEVEARLRALKIVFGVQRQVLELSDDKDDELSDGNDEEM
ncbi:hypothetical protein QQS21_001230 [Conoideocrella luteorostrata]|uniref:Uncharacterized protein n=1 Tax=Conoideocrella luteorostrata TaxID=1105319 RepID=A0AAJ0FYI2_9HYPO|nr:hypothetical protein QQS21_001230 [Conoideocrella luteorostrata]